MLYKSGLDCKWNVNGVKGSGFRVQGSGLWWRLRRKYIWGDARRFAGGRFPSYRQPSPRGEGGERSEPDRVLAG